MIVGESVFGMMNMQDLPPFPPQSNEALWRNAKNSEKSSSCGFGKGTVDGRNPAPVDMVNFPLFAGFYTCQVVQDFFHQQYLKPQFMAILAYQPLVSFKAGYKKPLSLGGVRYGG